MAMLSPQGCRLQWIPFIARSIWAYVSPLSVLGPGSVQAESFSAQVGNRTRAHGDESNPLEISMSSAMKGEPGLVTGLTTLGALLPFIRAWKSGHRNLSQARIEPEPGPHPLPTALPEGVAPLHTVPPVPVMPPVPVNKEWIRGSGSGSTPKCHGSATLICTIVGLNGTLVKAKIRTWDHFNVSISASTSVLFRPTMVPMPNLALIETKRITVHPYPTAAGAGPNR
jgi:hypothetical protein